MKPIVSIVMPALNEASTIAQTLQSARVLETIGLDMELILVDGGSQDNTKGVARPLADQILDAARGRARQMNAGAVKATGDYLMFLHADTRLTTQAATELQHTFTQNPVWGRFDVCIEGQPLMLRVISFMMNLRSRLTGIATGDQAIFVRRDVFEALGGFTDQPLMEDIEISKQLRKQARPACLKGPVMTSGRRWETHGVWSTMVLMWRLRWRYWRGESAQALARAYQR